MKRFVLIICLALVLKLPLEIWGQLSEEERMDGLQELADQFCATERCVDNKVRVSFAHDKNFLYLKFECEVANAKTDA